MDIDLQHHGQGYIYNCSVCKGARGSDIQRHNQVSIRVKENMVLVFSTMDRDSDATPLSIKNRVGLTQSTTGFRHSAPRTETHKSLQCVVLT